MYLGFSRRLKGMSSFRIGAGARLKGWTAVFILLGYFMFYLFYWSILACMWCLYGLFLLFYLPIRALIKLIKNKSVTKTNTIS